MEVDGVWASFSPAYFIDLSSLLATWTRPLRPGGWLALTEIDDFLAHEPVTPRTRELLAGYAADALAGGRYDFHMGGKLAAHVQRAGLRVAHRLDLPDLEFAFEGPARADVLDGWRTRFARMPLLAAYCGPEWPAVRDDFLGCLASPDHHSLCRVRCCVAIQPGRSS